jgi:hypothetical protein
VARRRILDAYCCAGGAAVGYARAGWEVVGVDKDDQPEYPFEFVKADALDFIDAHGREFDAIHTSPPCQASSAPTKGTNKARRGHLHVDLIPDTRAVLKAVGRPSVIENVVGSVLRRDLTLCGEMFGLRVIRHRYFEIEGWSIGEQPFHVPHRGRVRGWRHGVYYDGPYLAVYGEGGGKATLEECQEGLGITHITDRSKLVEAIPPAYTQWIGERLIEQVA